MTLIRKKREKRVIAVDLEIGKAKAYR